MMLTVAELANRAEVNLSEVPRDILEFNYRALATGALERIEAMEKRHSEEITRLRELIDVGTHVTAMMRRAQHEGRKTVRIAETLAEAQRRVDASR